MTSDAWLQYLGVGATLFGYYIGITLSGIVLRFIGALFIAAWAIQTANAPLFVLFAIASGLIAIAIAAPSIRLWLEGRGA